MKIMSLNVNRFSGMEERDYTNLIASLDKCPKANEIIALVQGFLLGCPDGVVFLYEVPYCKYGKERPLYQNFHSIFSTEQYKISSPGQKADSCTLAIWNKNSDWKSENNCLGKAIRYTNKYVELTSEKANLCLMGIHAPLESKYNTSEKVQKFFDALKIYAETHKNEKLIILGDFNIATDEWRAKERKEQMEKDIKVAECKNFFRRRKWLLETMPSIDYSDIVDPEKPTYFWERTTIDHALVSPGLKDKVTKPALVIPKDELELSDHAVIIVTIDE